MISVGSQIQLLRKEKGFSQGQLVDMVGVSLTQLHHDWNCTSTKLETFPYSTWSGFQ